MDCSTLPLIPFLMILSVKQGGIKYHFWVFGMTRLGIEPRYPGPLVNTLTIIPVPIFRLLTLALSLMVFHRFSNNSNSKLWMCDDNFSILSSEEFFHHVFFFRIKSIINISSGTWDTFNKGPCSSILCLYTISFIFQCNGMSGLILLSVNVHYLLPI